MRGIVLTALSLLTCHTALAAPIDTAEVDRRINKLMMQPNMVGLSIVIIEDGKPVFTKGYGETIKGSENLVTKDTVFRWASLSKSIAAAAALDVAEDGHFGLMSPVKAHAASLRLPPSKHNATLEDILTHRTGLPAASHDKMIEAGATGRTARRALNTITPRCEPTDCHYYQNVAFDAVSEMIETATQLPYKAVVAERIFTPLKMESASLTLKGLEQSRNWAKPHNRRGQTYKNVKPTYYRIPAAAGVNSSAADLGKWMLALMSTNNAALSETARLKMQTPHAKTPWETEKMQYNYHALKNAHYGLGLRLYDLEGRKVVGHRGAVQGYRSLMLFDPTLKTGVGVLWNSSSGRPVGLQLEIMDQVYGKPKRDWMRLSQK